MDQSRPPPPPYSPSMADSPAPPYRAPLRDRPTTVQQAVTDPGTNPPLPAAPGDVRGAVRRLGPERSDSIQRIATAATPEFKPPMPERPENIEGAVLRRDIVPRRFVHQVECPGGGDEEIQLHGADPHAQERTTSAGEHRAEHGEVHVKTRFWSWVLQLAVWALLLGMLITIGRFRAGEKHNEGLGYSDSDYEHFTDRVVLVIFFCIFFPLSLFFYYQMCVDAGTRKFVANIDRELNVQQYVQQLRTAIPVVRFDATCYHFEPRTRWVPVMSTDANGRVSTNYRFETYQAQIVSHTADEDYSFNKWEDATGALPGTDSVEELAKLFLSKKLEFLTDAAEQKMTATYESFCAANRRDLFQKYQQEIHIKGFKELSMWIKNLGEPSCWVSSYGYLVASLLLANVPYRYWLDWKTGIVRLTITKKIA